MNINMGFSCTFRNTRFAWVWWYLTLVRGLHKCEILELNMRFLRSNISYFHPVSTKKSISEFKCPLLTFSLSPLNYPRSVPSWQCPSPWLLPANLPPSPPLPSPPPCWQLHVLISHLAHSWDQPLSKAGDSCHADFPPGPDVSCFNGHWTGRASTLPPPSHMPAPAVCILPRPSLTPVCVLCPMLLQNVQRRNQVLRRWLIGPFSVW